MPAWELISRRARDQVPLGELIMQYGTHTRPAKGRVSGSGGKERNRHSISLPAPLGQTIPDRFASHRIHIRSRLLVFVLRVMTRRYPVHSQHGAFDLTFTIERSKMLFDVLVGDRVAWQERTGVRLSLIHI